MLAYTPRHKYVGTIPFDTTQQRTLDLPKDGAIAALLLRLCGTLTLAGGSTSGSVITSVPAPLALIQQLTLTRNPESFAGPLVLAPEQLILLQTLVAMAFERAAARTPPSSGAAASYTIDAELLIPCGLLDMADTWLPSAGRTSFTLGITWPTSVANARDAIFSGNDRTFSNDATDPLRVEVYALDAIGAVPAPLLQLGLRTDQVQISATGENPKDLSTTIGEVHLATLAVNYNNSARANVVGAPNNRLSIGWGQTEPVIAAKPSDLQQKNASDYAIPAGSWDTGVYVLDLARLYKGPANVPPVAAAGGVPRVVQNTGSTAPTSVANMRFLSLVGRYTEAGRKALEAAG